MIVNLVKEKLGLIFLCLGLLFFVRSTTHQYERNGSIWSRSNFSSC